jgi:outer membrane protein assembly factor BamB
VSALATGNPHNVLSTTIAFTAEEADSARVVYLDENQRADSTPYVNVTGFSDTIVTLGLRPATSYRNVVEVLGSSGRITSDTLVYRTSSLPEELQSVVMATSGAGAAGLNLTALQVGGVAVYALAFDSAGVIRWYRRFEGNDRIGHEIKQQPNGRFTLYRGGSSGFEKAAGHYIEFTSAGDSVRAIAVAPPRYLDNHELLITSGADGAERFNFFTYEHRISDLTAIGGAAGVLTAGHQLIRLRADGTTEFEWNSWAHFSLSEWIEQPQPNPQAPVERDFDHPNSLSFDRDGNYVVSFRNLAQVVKIDAATGAIVWRLGGLGNQFSIRNDPLGGFSAQHSASVLADGNILLFDNGNRHQVPESRAVEYSLDTDAMTATLVWEFRHSPPLYAPALGSAQRLIGGNTLIGYGRTGQATEVGRDGRVVWESTLTLAGEPARMYRLVRIASLYRYLDP